MRWWPGTSNSSQISSLLSPETTPRSPSILLTTSLPPRRWNYFRLVMRLPWMLSGTLRMRGCGSTPWPSWGSSSSTERSSTGLPGFWSHWGRVARLMRGKMTWRKVVIRILKISFKFNLSGTQLLEVYTLEIQMYTAQKYNKKLKALYDQVLA